MATDQTLHILALAGSYRKGSFNQALLHAAQELSPAGVEVSDFDLRTVPHFDEDIEAAGPPQEAQDLKDAVAAADAVLFVTPEYNSGVPGVLKNGLDWTSRIYPDAPIGDKIVAVIGATPGRSGTKYAQANLRQSATRAGANVLDVELLLDHATAAIEDGVVTSDEVKAQLSAVLDALVAAIVAEAETPAVES